MFQRFNVRLTAEEFLNTLFFPFLMTGTFAVFHHVELLSIHQDFSQITDICCNILYHDSVLHKLPKINLHKSFGPGSLSSTLMGKNGFFYHLISFYRILAYFLLLFITSAHC